VAHDEIRAVPCRGHRQIHCASESIGRKQIALETQSQHTILGS
jgi:hypothetical protein